MMISVIVPIYRQEKTIEQDLKNIEDSVKKLGQPFEIIAVVDGSPDASYDNARRVLSDRVKVFSYSVNKGKGYALRYGVVRARGDIIVFLDSGMDIDSSGISMLLAHMDWYQADVIVASKRHPVSKVNYPLSRIVISLAYQILVKLLFGLKIRDTQTGLKAFRREVLEKVMPRLLVKNYAIDIEILSVAYHLGFKRIFEAPVNVNHQFSSLTKPSILQEIINMLKDTLAVFYRLRILHYYDDKNQRRWIYDPDLEMNVNVG